MGAEHARLKQRASSTQRYFAKPNPVQLYAQQSPITQLQRSLGNQAILRLLSSSVLQAKLRIGQPGDIYRQEADRVADEVMHSPDPQVQRQPEEDEEEFAQDKQVLGHSLEVPPHLTARIKSPDGGGRSLPSSAGAFLEPRFGLDFSNVPVHTGTKAAEAARQVKARAFTVGQDVVFGEGQYALESAEGKRLLAHEMVHVVQQGEGEVRRRPTINQPGGLYEQEAGQVGRAVMRRAQQLVRQKADKRLVPLQGEEVEPKSVIELRDRFAEWCEILNSSTDSFGRLAREAEEDAAVDGIERLIYELTEMIDAVRGAYGI